MAEQLAYIQQVRGSNPCLRTIKQEITMQVNIDNKWIVRTVIGIVIALISWLGKGYWTSYQETQTERHNQVIESTSQLKDDVGTLMKSVHQIEIDMAKQSGIDQNLLDKYSDVKEDIKEIKEKLDD